MILEIQKLKKEYNEEFIDMYNISKYTNIELSTIKPNDFDIEIYSDYDIYEYFNLTQEEQNYIENTFKI